MGQRLFEQCKKTGTFEHGGFPKAKVYVLLPAQDLNVLTSGRVVETALKW